MFSSPGSLVSLEEARSSNVTANAALDGAMNYYSIKL